MAYRFVQAKWFTPDVLEARAVMWHMAEGAGTVSWLTHPSNDNSAHFVVQTDGTIVQMVKLTDAAHSAHVAIDADTNDADDCGIYSIAVARAVLGDGIRDINRFVVAVEVEGFRKDGPNAAQTEAIVELATYLQVRLPSIRGHIGHRDVQDYKSCPGCKFPWSRIGGHGLLEETIVGLRLTITNPAAGKLAIAPGVDAIRVSDGVHYKVPVQASRDAYVAQIAPDGSMGYLVDLNGDELHFIRRTEAVTFVPTPVSLDPDAAADAAAAKAVDDALATLDQALVHTKEATGLITAAQKTATVAKEALS